MSACLLGQRVRWDGGHKRERLLADALGRHVEWVPVCPEVELGLGVPREPIRLEGDAGSPRLVGVTSRIDHTTAMASFAGDRIRQLARQGLAGYVLKSDSPSCGMAGVKVHGRARHALGRSPGLFARALAERLPLLPVEEERRLRDPALRAAFVERVLVYARWTRAVAAGMTRRRLAAFHAAHALLLIAHDPAACRRLEALVGSAARRPLRPLVTEYAAGLMQALRRPATRRGHARVLGLVLARLSSRLAPGERRRSSELVARYRRGLVPLGAPLGRLRRHVGRLADEELGAQVYLDAHPLREDAE